MSIQRIASLATAEGDILGVTVSPFYEFYDDSNQYTWAVDVDLGDGSEVVRSVPVAMNNKDIIYAQQGKPVALRRENNRLVVVGLSKTVKSFRHIMEVCFEDDIAVITDERTEGYKIRALTYGELGSLVPGMGYGLFPYGTMGRFDSDGELIEIIESRPV